MQVIRIIKFNPLTMSTTGLCETFVPNSVYTQCVRWKRKPIWLPPSKSKLFHVPKRPVIPIEDKLELQRLYNNYRTYMTSLRKYIRQFAKKNEVQTEEVVDEQTKEEDFKVCSAINDEWNAEIAKNRKIKLAKEKEERKDFILKRLLHQEQCQELQKEELNEQIRKIKKESVTFITAENLDAAIEECLTNVVNYNRALDLEGNWHEGKYPPVKPSIPPREETQKSAAIEQ